MLLTAQPRLPENVAMHSTPTPRAWTRQTLSMLSCVLFACGAGGAFAADCPQDKALYSDASGGYQLAFRPVGTAAVRHLFAITVKNADLVLDGHVIDSDGSARPEGALSYNCPEGDATGAELRACQVWTGVITAIAANGAGGFLGSERAAVQIVLPDFSSALVASSAWGQGKATVPASNVFTLKGCAA